MIRESDMIKIVPDPRDWIIAQEMANDLRRYEKNKSIKSHFHTKDADRDDRFGGMGELIFKSFLETECTLDWKHINKQDGLSDSGIDFRMLKSTIDVKTAYLNKPIERIIPNFKFLFPKEQLENSNVDFLVNVQISFDYQLFYIIGYIRREDALKCGIGKNRKYLYPPYEITLDKIKPIRQIFDEARLDG